MLFLLLSTQLTYRKDKEEAMKNFTQVADSVGTQQASQQQRIASNIGYQTQPDLPPPQG
jgi:hypothetical protein